MDLHTTGIIQHVVSCAWLLLVHVSSSSVHAVACIRTSLLLTAEESSIEQIGPITLIQASVHGHLGCFHLLAKAPLEAQMVKILPAMQETRAESLGQEDPLDKGMATHFSILACRIPWTEEPGGLQSNGVAQSQTRLSDSRFHFFWLL